MSKLKMPYCKECNHNPVCKQSLQDLGAIDCPFYEPDTRSEPETAQALIAEGLRQWKKNDDSDMADSLNVSLALKLAVANPDRGFIPDDSRMFIKALLEVCKEEPKGEKA